MKGEKRDGKVENGILKIEGYEGQWEKRENRKIKIKMYEAAIKKYVVLYVDLKKGIGKAKLTEASIYNPTCTLLARVNVHSNFRLSIILYFLLFPISYFLAINSHFLVSRPNSYSPPFSQHQTES